MRRFWHKCDRLTVQSTETIQS